MNEGTSMVALVSNEIFFYANRFRAGTDVGRRG